jgi:pyruvate dehydrogenase E2 component (dihydrolipoamide acetyltransferase)
MPREIKMPKLSDTMEEGTLNVWRKSEGDAIEKGDILLEIETDKADMEFEAYMSGVLVKILVPAGETVAIGTPIAVVRLKQDSDEDVAGFLADRSLGAAAPRPVVPEPAAVAPPSESPAPGVPAAFAPATLPPPASTLPFFAPDPDRVRATPSARVLARGRGVDLSEIAGSGPEGAVLVRDVELYLEALDASDESSAPGDVLATPVAQRLADEQHVDLTHEIKLSQKRKFLIRNMVESKQSTPHFYIAMEVDADPLAVLRRRLKKEGRRITYTHMIMKASALALERFPEANATFRDNRILRYQPINIAVAVDVQDELVAPVVKDCQGRDLEDLAVVTDALIRKARERKLAPEDYSDGTFTVSNLGMLGVDHFYAIITPPQSMALSVGALRTVPVVDAVDQTIRAGRRMDFGLACDHRVLDGARAARFLEELVRLLESPDELLESSAKHGA